MKPARKMFAAQCLGGNAMLLWKGNTGKRGQNPQNRHWPERTKHKGEKTDPQLYRGGYAKGRGLYKEQPHNPYINRSCVYKPLEIYQHLLCSGLYQTDPNLCEHRLMFAWRNREALSSDRVSDAQTFSHGFNMWLHAHQPPAAASTRSPFPCWQTGLGCPAAKEQGRSSGYSCGMLCGIPGTGGTAASPRDARPCCYP